MRPVTLFLIWIYAGTFLQVAAQRGGAQEKPNDRAVLVQGVREIASPGAPGSLAVFSPTAGVVVTGKGDGDAEVAVAASAHRGRGRIVAFAHDGYFSEDQIQVADTARFLANALRWAAAEKSKPKVGLINGHSLQPLFEQEGAVVRRITLDDSFQGFNVLVLTPYRLSPQQVQRLRSFVSQGGGLLVAATGWGWQQGANRPMTEFPGNHLLAGSGLAWTDGFAGKTGETGFLVGEAPSPYVNAATALTLLSANTTAGPNDLACATASIRLALSVSPPSESNYREEIRKLLNGLSQADLVPTRGKPVRADDPKRRFAVGLETALAMQAPVEELTAMPAAAEFPGAVPADAARGEQKVTIDTAVPGWHSLGLYAAPGEKITMAVPRNATSLGLTVQIGSHTDHLWNLDAWERAPQVVRRFPIVKSTTTATNSFGGLIYIDVPEGTAPGKLAVTIKNAVKAPLYRLGETTRDDWKNQQRQHPGPWAELAGKNVIFTVPSSAVRDLDDPQSLMRLWDQIIAAQDAFASSPPRHRPERIVADVQISVGYMHSGYPIMIPTDDSVPLELNEARIRKEGAWGHLHELGHNHQQAEWTFEGTGEVTNNLIVLYVQDKILGLRFDSGHEAIRDRDQRNRRIREFMAKGAPHQEWTSDPFLALMMYIQLYEAFGPEPFQTVFAEYAKLPEADRPQSDDDKRDQWLIRLSRAVGKNLAPFFRAWGLPTREQAQAAVSNLPDWMPKGFEPKK